jgi:hypothetical protein
MDPTECCGVHPADPCLPWCVNYSARELAGCEHGGDHVPTSNEHRDAWCSRCGERLLLPGYAGGPEVRV